MLEYLKEALEPIGYEVSVKDDFSIFISHSCIPWVSRLIKEDDSYFPVFYFRTYFGYGERTDIHEIVPMTAMLFFRAIGLFSFRFLGQHNEWSEIEDELYGVYIFPAQPLSERIRPSLHEDVDAFIEILDGFVYICNNHMSLLGIAAEKEQACTVEDSELIDWVGSIKKIVGPDIECTYNKRINPDWYYFRSFSSGVSAVKSKSLPSAIRILYEQFKDRHKCLPGISAHLFLTDHIKNCLDNEKYKLAGNIIAELEGSADLLVIPHDNIAFVLGQEHIVAVVNDGGISSFFDEKEKVKARNAWENQILFSDRRIRWSIKSRSQSSIFEDLILELLSREPYVISAKKVAPTNQGDNGRDIICEYNTSYHKVRVGKSEPTMNVGQLIVQCKTNLDLSAKKSIGKSDVSIADTIHDYQPNAYLLVVNTQITRDLTEYLEKIKAREKLHWIDWWNSFDIEERLRINPDIMSRYKDIVGYIDE